MRGAIGRRQFDLIANTYLAYKAYKYLAREYYPNCLRIGVFLLFLLRYSKFNKSVFLHNLCLKVEKLVLISRTIEKVREAQQKYKKNHEPKVKM